MGHLWSNKSLDENPEIPLPLYSSEIRTKISIITHQTQVANKFWWRKQNNRARKYSKLCSIRLEGGWGRAGEPWLSNLFVLIKRYNEQIRWVLYHELCNQISCNGPRLVLPCLLSNVPSSNAIVVFRPSVFRQALLHQFYCFLCYLRPSSFYACCCQ